MSELVCPIPPKDYPDILRALSDLLVEHGHDAEAGTLRAVADGVAGLVRGPTLVWPEGGPTGGVLIVESVRVRTERREFTTNGGIPRWDSIPIPIHFTIEATASPGISWEATNVPLPAAGYPRVNYPLF